MFYKEYNSSIYVFNDLPLEWSDFKINYEGIFICHSFFNIKIDRFEYSLIL